MESVDVPLIDWEREGRERGMGRREKKVLRKEREEKNEAARMKGGKKRKHSAAPLV